ncbi:MAG: polysaccharide deacetylase family protein [Myxococcaceae bacterium]
MELQALAKRAAKDALANVVHRSGARRLMAAWQRRRAGGRRVTIVSYHRVVPDFSEAARTSIPGLLVSQRTLRGHLEEAAAAGYELVSLEDALEVLSGRRRARRDQLVVTFDDGYRDVAQYAAPVLLGMGVPATCYLATGFIGTEGRFDHDRLHHLLGLWLSRPPHTLGPPGAAAALLEPVLTGGMPAPAALDGFISQNPRKGLLAAIAALERGLGGTAPLSPAEGAPMSWDEVRRLSHQGFRFGAHTQHHAVLTLMDQAGALAEIRGSKEAIEREIAQPVRDFAYCNGWYSRELVRLLVAAGFRSAVTTEDEPNHIGGDPFALKRKVLWESFSLGLGGRYSAPLTTCQLDDVFGMLGLTHPVPGLRPDVVPG